MALRAGTAYVDILPRISSGFGNEIDRNIKGDMQKSGENAGSVLGGTIKKLATVAAGAFAVDKVKDFVKGSIDAASDLNETVSKSGVIFGAQAVEMDKWAKTAATSLGLSRKSALDAASGFGDMFSQIGFTGKQAAGMSKDVVKLATDLGSFNNLDTSEVLDMISGSLRGEYDSLQRVIPNISAARVQQEAMAATGKKNADQLTAQEKAAATLAIIHKDGARAAGDFERTSGGLANQQRILSARMEDVKARIGSALLPVMLKLTTAVADNLNPAIDYLTGLFHTISEQVQFFYETLTTGMTQDDAALPIEKIALFVRENLMPILEKVAAFVQDNLKPILIGLGITIALLAAPIATAIAALVFLYVRFDAVRTVVDAVVRFFRDVVIPAIIEVSTAIVQQMSHAIEWVEKNWGRISEAVGHVMVVIKDIIDVYLTAIRFIWEAVGDDIMRYVDRLFHAIYGVVNGVLDALRGLIQFVLDLINGDWGKAWHDLLQVVRGVWDAIYALISGALGMIQSVIGGAASIIGKAAAGMFDGIKTAFKMAINWIIRAWNALEFKIPGFHIGPVGYDGFVLGVPDIPELANGGRVLSSGLALVGERGPELMHLDKGAVVEPLDRVGGRAFHLGPIYTQDPPDIIEQFRRMEMLAG